jgi:hypothetical protein
MSNKSEIDRVEELLENPTLRVIERSYLEIYLESLYRVEPLEDYL